MAQLITVRLNRHDAQPWGFRLQGGKDFGTPLVVQKVNGGSIADQTGLVAGDAVIKVNNIDVFNLRHKDAQDIVVRAGNNFDVTVQRGGGTWRPQVTPTGSLPSPSPQLGNTINPVTRTSLAYKQPESQHIGAGYNSPARPFSGVNGSDGQVKSIVNKQYNTPVGIYSEESIAETLSAQAEVLAGGVLGVNFKKNEKIYNAANSEVLKALHEAEQEPDEPAARSFSPVVQTSQYQQQHYHHPQQQHQPQQQQQQQQQQHPHQQQYHNAQQQSTIPVKHVSAPISQASQIPNPGGLPIGQNICAECDRLIVGVFVRIKDKNLHAECFKCATCGTSLRNQGYFNFRNKLYCDVHAKLAALNNPPPGTDGYLPVPIKANQKLNANTISAALSAHGVHPNGRSHSPSNNNPDPILASVNTTINVAHPIQMPSSHSRTSSSSSSNAGTANSFLSSLSSNKSSSLEKLSPAHSRQSSGGSNLEDPVTVTRIDTTRTTATTTPTAPKTPKTTTLSAATSVPAPPPPPLPPTTGSPFTKSYRNERTIYQKHQNENDMNSSNRNGNNFTTTITNGSNGVESETYSPLLKEYSNKKRNDTVDSGTAQNSDVHKSSLADAISNGGGTAAASFDATAILATTDKEVNGQTESIYGTIRSNAKVQCKDEFQYVTLDGSVIKSVIPPGKGVKTSYKVNSGYGGPRPFNSGPLSPRAQGPQSPTSYPPPTQHQPSSWSQPIPKPATNPYATLPRTGAQSQGRYNTSTYRPGSNYNNNNNYYNNNNYNRDEDSVENSNDNAEHVETEEVHPEFLRYHQAFDDEIEIVEAVRPAVAHFNWPPTTEDGHCTPTASPLYIPPPGTQHIQPKPLKTEQYRTLEEVQEQHIEQQWQTRSAPELACVSSSQVEIESSSDSYTSTSTTTTTTSEEYQKMFQAQIQAYQAQNAYDQSGSEIDYHMDMEVADAVLQKQGDDQSYSVSGEYSSGRRSAQECVGIISGPLSTFRLIDLVREATPKPETPTPKPHKKVEFADHNPKEDEKISSYVKYQNGQETEEEEPCIRTETHQEYIKRELEKQNRSEVEITEEPPKRLFAPTPEIKIEIPEPKPVPPSNIPNPVPKEWISPMVKALTTAPDKHVELSDIFTHGDITKPVSLQEAKLGPSSNQFINEVASTAEPSQIFNESPRKGSFISSLLATAPTDQWKFAPSPSEAIPLPEETTPYLPPPINMTPYEQESIRPKSPLLAALITAPDRPYTPFGHDVPSHFDDLPNPKEKLTFVDALTTASDRGYTPLNSENILALNLEEEERRRKDPYHRPVTPAEEIKISEKIEQITESTLESQMDRQLSAFANVAGFRSVNPFQPKKDCLISQAPRTSISSVTQSIGYQQHRESIISSGSGHRESITSASTQQERYIQSDTAYCQAQAREQQRSIQSDTLSGIQNLPTYHSIDQSTSAHLPNDNPQQDQETDSKISFPPPNPLGPTAKKTLLSGLHKPDNIPQYQRNWTVLPSQRPVRTPEPLELRENVPLAFIESPSPATVHTLNATQTQASAAPSNVTRRVSETKSNATGLPAANTKSVPIFVEERAGPITMTFQSLDVLEEDHSNAHPRPFTPSLLSRHAPVVPFYQTPDKLVCEECPATCSRAFDPRSPSPLPDRSKSPAPGPPPNPLSAIRAPRIREDDYVLRPTQAGSITTGQSYLGTQQQLQIQNQQQQVLQQYQTLSQGSSQSFIDKPEIVAQKTIGDLNIQTRSKESQLKEEKHASLESKETTQVGNTQVERRRKVVEEYEHTQSAKTVEVLKTSGGASNESYEIGRPGRTGFVANQARRLSGLEQEISSISTQSQAISARAASLGVHETVFPQLTSPEPERRFPTKVIFPSHDEPQPASYIISPNAANKLKDPPPEYGAQLHESSGQLRQTSQTAFSFSSAYASSSVSQSTTAARNIVAATNSTKATSLPSPISVPAYKPSTSTVGCPSICLTKSEPQQKSSYPPQQLNSTNIGYNPTPSTTGSSGFKPPQSQAQPSALLQQIPSNTNPIAVSDPSPASAGPNKGGAVVATSAPKRGRGTLNKAVGPGVRVPLCGCCNAQIRGPFITALGRIWCPDHFMCVNAGCRRPLQDIGFVEEKGDLYCEYCFEKYLAPTCSKCQSKIKGDCLNAIGRHFHPECFNCTYCGKLFGNTPFFLEEGEPYCEADWNELFTTKCFACGFPVEAGDRWVEALNHNYHSQCFNCTMCKKNLEGQSFYNKGGRPFCKNHAR